MRIFKPLRILRDSRYSVRMSNLRRLLPSVLILFAFSAAALAQETALDRYVKARDAVYGCKHVSSTQEQGYKLIVLELTSQTWRSEKEVDKPVWKHWITIVKPDQIKNNKALMYIGGGSSNNPPPTKAAERNVRIALEVGSVAAEVSNIPNQPLHFTDSPDKARTEDDIIAYS